MKLDGGKVLREREIRALNAHEGAKLAGISANALLNAEHGRDIQQGTARKIAKAYGLTVADLYPDPEGAGSPKVVAQPSLEQGRKLRDVGERYRTYAEGLNAYCDDYERLLESGTVAQEDVDGFVRTLQTVGRAMPRVARDELTDLADALGLAQRVGEQTLSGVSEDAVVAGIDAQLFEHSLMHDALQRYYAVGRRLAEATGNTEWAEKMGRMERSLATVS